MLCAPEAGAGEWYLSCVHSAKVIMPDYTKLVRIISLVYLSKWCTEVCLYMLKCTG